jgi:hypothetical protein
VGVPERRNGESRALRREQPGLRNTTATPTPIRTTGIAMITEGRVADVLDLDAGRRRRVQRVDDQAGPWWPGWRSCRSWTAAEASRPRRWSA